MNVRPSLSLLYKFLDFLFFTLVSYNMSRFDRKYSLPLYLRVCSFSTPLNSGDLPRLFSLRIVLGYGPFFSTIDGTTFVYFYILWRFLLFVYSFSFTSTMVMSFGRLMSLFVSLSVLVSYMFCWSLTNYFTVFIRKCIVIIIWNLHLPKSKGEFSISEPVHTT